MKRIINSNFIKIFSLIFISLLGVEISFRLETKMNFDTSMIRIFLSNFIFSVFISYFLSLIKIKKIRYIISFIIIFVFTCYAFAQLGFNNFIGVFMSVNASSQLGAVTDYVREFILSFKLEYYLLLLNFFIPLILHFIFVSKIKDDDEIFEKRKYFNLYKGLISLFLVLIGLFLYYETLFVSWMQNDYQLISNKDLLRDPSNPSLTISSFGINLYAIDDIFNYIFPYDSSDSILVVSNQKEKEITDYSREIDDTIWNEIIDEENNSNYKTINNYLINREISDKNDYTGVFKGKNVIFVLMESVGEMIINEELYPNFYKMYTNGITFTNNYSPRNSCSTGNNEFSALTSLYSIYNSCTSNIYKNNTYSSALFNIFNNDGYYTVGMHDYTEAYYYRSKIHINMGASEYYGVQKLGIKYYNIYEQWANDADFAEVAMDIMFEKEEPFMLWMVTVSGHQPYNVSSNEGDKYFSLFEDTDYPDSIKRYLSKIKVTDDALGVLLKRLEEAGQLDNTVLVLTGDHYPYGLSAKNINYVLDYDLSDYENERTPFVIYNPNVEAKQITSYTTYMNILPTVANLFDLNYDPRYYMGKDALDNNYESIAVFSDGSWKNEYAYFNASTGEIKYYSDKTYTSEEIKNINKTITNDKNISSLIIKNNYFEYLNNKILEKKQNIIKEGE